MERVLIDYFVNSLWQVPLLAGGVWLLLRIAKPEPQIQHWMWLGVLVTGVVLPLCGVQRNQPAIVTIHSSDVIAPVSTTINTGSIAPAEVVRHTGKYWINMVAGAHAIPLAAGMMDWLFWLYLAVIALGGLRFIQRRQAAVRLVKQSCEVLPGEDVLQTFQDYARRLGVELPRLHESRRVLSPVIIGSRKPVLLLPKNFLQRTQDEIEAALCHELAHVRRRDYLMNLLCQAVALPLVWHPAIWAVQRRIRGTREMACDAIAAEEMRSEIRYAKCLLAVAGSMMADGCGQTQALGLFDNNTLEERVMWLTRRKRAMSIWTKVAHMAGSVGIIAAVTIVAAIFRVTPILAHAQTTAPAPSAIQSTPVVTKGELDTPGYTAIGHGKGASVIPGKGEYIHRWTGSDGMRYVISNHQPQEPTMQERSRIEKNFAQRVAKLAAKIQINSPEFRKQMEAMNAQLKVLNSANIQRQIEDATAAVNSPEFKEQMAKINSPEFRKQMAAMNAQLKALNMSDEKPLAMGRGRGAHIVKDQGEKGKGEYIHRWKGEDGEPYMILNRESRELTPEEQHRIEKEFAERMAKMRSELKAFNMSDVQWLTTVPTARSRKLEQEMAEVQKAVRNGELQRGRAIQILKDAETQLEKTKNQ